ncbi:MAG: hypothetical protein ACRD21_03005 [Vicinamibacteria bacterium]
MKSRLHRFLRLAFAMPLLLTFVMAAPASAGDAFLKGGIIFHPRDVGFEGRWRAAFGSDYPVNFSETLFAGFEVQTSVYRQDVQAGGPTATLIPANAFFNVKYKSGSLTTRPFAGFGLGLLSEIRFVSSQTDWRKDFGFHVLGGVEFGRLSLELQIQRAFESEADTELAAYVGFVW